MLGNCCVGWDTTDLYTKPHRIDIINQITRTYLKIRLDAYSKILTSSIVKTASKRQKLFYFIICKLLINVILVIACYSL